MLRFAVVALVALPCAAGAQQWDSTSVDTIAPGVVHRRVVANSGPWRLNVLEVDLGNKAISLHGMKAMDSFVGRETVSAMSGRYNGPGKVVGAVNGDFFNVRTGESENNVVIEGELSKGVTLSDSPYDTFNARHSQLELDWMNRAYIEQLALDASLHQAGRVHHLNGINVWPSDSNSLVVYTKVYGDSSYAETATRHPTLLPVRLLQKKGDTVWYRVAGVIQEGGRAALGDGGAIAAGGARREELRAIARRGGTIRVVTRFSPDHGRLRTVVGGWPRIVRDGKSVAEYADFVEGTFPRFSSGRHPRTAAGISKNGSTLYLVTVDGRRESDSGMSLVEMANAMIQLGAYQAMNFDGGGSTTMVVNGTLINKPSDQTGERPVGSALLVVIHDGVGQGRKQQVEGRSIPPSPRRQ